MSEQPACSLPLWKVREQFQELRLDPSLLSLATGSSTSRCPRRECLFPSGKNLSTIGYLIGGQFPTLSLPSYASYETSRLSVDVCPPPRPIHYLEITFLPAFLWSGDLMSFHVPMRLYSGVPVGQTTL